MMESVDATLSVLEGRVASLEQEMAGMQVVRAQVRGARASQLVWASVLICDDSTGTDCADTLLHGLAVEGRQDAMAH